MVTQGDWAWNGTPAGPYKSDDQPKTFSSELRADNVPDTMTGMATVLSITTAPGRGPRIECTEDDGNLITAAPKLLAAARALLQWNNQHLPDCLLCGAKGWDTPHADICPVGLATNGVAAAAGR